MFRAFRYELHPTAEQAGLLRQHIGAARFVFNLALEQRRDWHRQYLRTEGRPITFASQCRELTDLRAELSWLSATPRSAQEFALRDVDAAFTSWRAGRTAYPRPRKRGDCCQVRYKGRDSKLKGLNAKWGLVRIPAIGWIKLRLTRPARGALKLLSVGERRGRWFVSLVCDIAHEAPAGRSATVGIDRGVAVTMALSTGEVYRLPAGAVVSANRLARAQRTLARRRKGSKRYAAQAARVARISAKAARIRLNFLHQASTAIARQYGMVAVEALSVTSMTASAAGTVEQPGHNVRQKAGLNRAILAQGWYAFEQMLAYKLEERGGILIKVPAAYTSQTCAECGVVDARSRKSQAVFECVACGHTDNADTNAAKEILRRSTAWLGVEGGHRSPREALTVEPLAA